MDIEEVRKKIELLAAQGDGDSTYLALQLMLGALGMSFEEAMLVLLPKLDRPEDNAWKWEYGFSIKHLDVRYGRVLTISEEPKESGKFHFLDREISFSAPDPDAGSGRYWWESCKSLLKVPEEDYDKIDIETVNQLVLDDYPDLIALLKRKLV